MTSGIFSAFRKEGYPSYYPEQKTAVLVDLTLASILYIFFIVAVAFFIILPGVRGTQRLYLFIRVTVSLAIGVCIAVVNYGYSWETAGVKTITPYRPYDSKPIRASIGLFIGLRGINVTLKGIPVNQINQTIDYNERFTWDWEPGRPGYGEDSSKINRQYIAAKWKGLPYPILWIAEYFTLNDGGMRYGLQYRLAGWFTHVFLWTSFALWLLSNLLLLMVVRYAAASVLGTGACLLLSNILFAAIHSPFPLNIPFEGGHLVTRYGWCFWLTLFVGLVCILLGTILLVMDLRCPDIIATFLGIDVLQDYEEFYADSREYGAIPASPKNSKKTTDGDAQNSAPGKDALQEVYGMRKRTLSTRFQRSSLRPTPAQRKLYKGHPNEELPVYENLAVQRFTPIGEDEDQPPTGSHEHIVMKPL